MNAQFSLIISAIMERLRHILHEGQVDKRCQYMIEVLAAVRKDGFKDHPAVLEELDLVQEEDQFTHMVSIEEVTDGQDMLSKYMFELCSLSPAFSLAKF